MNLRYELERRISTAIVAAGAPEGSPAMIATSARAEFGDYQANGVMSAAKKLKTNPRQLAARVAEQLAKGGSADLSDLAAKVEIAGPGFINIHLKAEWLSEQLQTVAADEKLGVPPATKPQTVVIDYSAPNLAKEMHVGHLRSTIIGDALARTLEFLGNNVIRQNHVGDWGTQFGMLVAIMKKLSVAKVSTKLDDLEEFYRQAKALFDSNPEFAKESREEVVRLQRGSGEPVDKTRMAWVAYREISLAHCDSAYRQLGIALRREDIRGESFYGGIDPDTLAYDASKDMLPKVIDDLKEKLGPAGVFKESQGARCVFLPEFVAKDGSPLPLIVQKSDEGYLYATTDLAAIRYRVGRLHADRVLYVVDARQGLHFRQVFATARVAKFAPESVSLEHIAFGTMMGDDGKPFKTRTGGTVKLMDLLSEAVERAYTLVSEKSPEIPEDQRRQIAQAVGVGGVKYADLAQNRNSDYVFSWDKMLSMDGNTAPYMQYAYARIRSIFRKGASVAQVSNLCHAEGVSKIAVTAPAERALAVKLMQFPETIATVANECLPNLLCGYLYELAGAFMSFYESCPVLQSDAQTRASRLALCDLTARTIKAGLSLLGIQTLEQM